MGNEKVIKLSTLFQDDSGGQIKLTKGQSGIFQIVAQRSPYRNQIIAPTQYGKSLSIALGVLLRVLTKPEKWAIVAPQLSKAMIIMRYIIEHTFDNDAFAAQLDIDISLERLKRERSRQRLTFRRGGEVFVLSADARSKKRVKEALMGFGAPNLILDESCLIDDDLYATAKRMIGGHKDNFLLEIGNPFRRNHFKRTWESDSYNKIFIDYHQGIKEGRYSPEFIDEMRDEAFFDILYECKFPPAEAVDERGYRHLLPDISVFEGKVEEKGKRRLGVDVGRGGDYNVWVIRTDNLAWVVDKDQNPDLMGTVSRTKGVIEDDKVKAEDAFVDDIGVGGGVVDRLKELGFDVNPAKSGESASNKEKYKNARAEAYWRLRKWLNDGGKLVKNEGFYQLEQIKFKEDSSSRLIIEPKEDMLKRGFKSPDVADALMLTFMSDKSIDWAFA